MGSGIYLHIAQNGIEVGFGSVGGTLSSTNMGNIQGNTVSGNIYTAGVAKPYVPTGILADGVIGPNAGWLNS